MRRERSKGHAHDSDEQTTLSVRVSVSLSLSGKSDCNRACRLSERARKDSERHNCDRSGAVEQEKAGGRREGRLEQVPELSNRSKECQPARRRSGEEKYRGKGQRKGTEERDRVGTVKPSQDEEAEQCPTITKGNAEKPWQLREEQR